MQNVHPAAVVTVRGEHGGVKENDKSGRGCCLVGGDPGGE